jgi:transcriptional regulator with XRE-family HTH domain
MAQCGTLAGYRAGCRCLSCRKASSNYAKRRHWLALYGRPTTRLVDAEPARRHVRTLQAQNIGCKRIAELAGVPAAAMRRLVYDGGKGKPVRRMKPEAAAAILAVRRPEPNLRVQVSAIGTQRRLRALIALGWTQRQLADRIGCSYAQFGQIVGGRQNKVEYRRAVAVRELYDELWDMPPNGDQRSITRSRNHASRRGWALPAAWDDDLIDIPEAEPWHGESSRRGRIRRVYLDDVEHLRRFGMSDDAIAEKLGVRRSAIQAAERRALEEQSAPTPEGVAS